MKVLQAARLMLCGHVMLFTFGCSRKSSPVAIEELPNKLVLFKMSTGNVIGTVGDERALLIGTPSAESTPAISKFIATKTKSSILIVVIADSPIDESQGDAGWGRKGAFVVMQENGLGRLGGHSMGLPLPLPPQLSQLGVDRPKISFSDVIAFDFKDQMVIG